MSAARHDLSPTQVQRPWRSTVRTTIAAGIGLLPLLPEIARAAGIERVPLVAACLAIAAAVARVLAIPGVEAWLRRWIPALAADAYRGRHRHTPKDHE